MNARAMTAHLQEPVPQRWHVLQLLRLMHVGHPFIRFWDTSFTTYLEGFPLAVHYFDFLDRNGYITPCAEDGWMANYYQLTPAGEELLDKGEAWWKTLHWFEKTWVIWHG